MQRKPTPPTTLISTISPTSNKTLRQNVLSRNKKEIPVVIEKVYPNSRIKYLYDYIIIFVSNFPYGFRGCFVCVKDDHYHISNCPQGTCSREDYEKKQKFILNLWTHKPWTKKDSLVWYIILAEKIKEGSIHPFNKNKT